MKSTRTRKVIISTTALAGVIGVTYGLAPSASASSMAQTSSAMSTDMMHGESQAAVNLRVALNSLLREHVSSSLDVTRALASGADQRKIDAAMGAQYANADELAAAVGSVYGGEAQAKFSELFKDHIVESNKYAMAVGDGDQAAKDAAAAELREYLTDLSAFFAAAIPGLPQQDAYGLLNEHEELINKSTEAYKAGDFVQSYQLEREALKQVSRLASALASGIIATQPDKF